MYSVEQINLIYKLHKLTVTWYIYKIYCHWYEVQINTKKKENKIIWYFKLQKNYFTFAFDATHVQKFTTGGEGGWVKEGPSQ